MENMTEEEICLLLDTYMYFDYLDAEEGSTLREVVENLPDEIKQNSDYKAQYEIMSKAVSRDEIGSLKICCQSKLMGYDEGTNAATFVSSDGEKVYVAYRGTHDGEWIDNGNGLCRTKTIQQERAVKYYDEVCETLDLQDKGRVVITGHSKGGNKAQYVTMSSDLSEHIDACYSIDGQGQSTEAILKWKTKYSKEEYEERTNKLFGINGENDFIHVLGTSIIPLSHISYIATASSNDEFGSYHDITRMFGRFTGKKDENGKQIVEFSDERNRYVSGRGDLASLVALLSADIMLLPRNLREGSATALMQVMETMMGGKDGGSWIGVNGEVMKVSDLFKFLDAGLPVIGISFLRNPEGKKLIESINNNEPLKCTLTDKERMGVNYNALIEEGERLKNISGKIKEIAGTVSLTESTLPFYIDGYVIKKQEIERAAESMGEKANKLILLSEKMKNAGELYRSFDEGIALN